MTRRREAFRRAARLNPREEPPSHLTRRTVLAFQLQRMAPPTPSRATRKRRHLRGRY